MKSSSDLQKSPEKTQEQHPQVTSPGNASYLPIEEDAEEDLEEIKNYTNIPQTARSYSVKRGQYTIVNYAKERPSHREAFVERKRYDDFKSLFEDVVSCMDDYVRPPKHNDNKFKDTMSFCKNFGTWIEIGGKFSPFSILVEVSASNTTSYLLYLTLFSDNNFDPTDRSKRWTNQTCQPWVSVEKASLKVLIWDCLMLGRSGRMM